MDEVVVKAQYEKCSPEKEDHLQNIKNIILGLNAQLEGNAFYVHQSFDLYPELYTKQLNLFWCGTKAKKICEIGFNAGHSVLLMLLGRDKTPLDFTVFDIGHHSYTRPCLEYMKSKFEHVRFEYIEGDSAATMPKWINANKSAGIYDLVHVDGGHTEACVFNDMKNADILVSKGGFIILDDTNAPHINKYVDMYLSSGSYTEVNILKTSGYEHRIIQKNI